MAEQNNDYEYEPKDVRIIKTAFISLKEDETKGFWIGVAAALAAALVARRTQNFKSTTTNLIGLTSGVFTYNLFTHRSRSYYGKLASIANINANTAINRLMKY
jgi:hypothetical protein